MPQFIYVRGEPVSMYFLMGLAGLLFATTIALIKRKAFSLRVRDILRVIGFTVIGAILGASTASYQGIYRLSSNNQLKEGRLYSSTALGLDAVQGFIASDNASGSARSQSFLNNVALHELSRALGWWGHSNTRYDVMDRWNLNGSPTRAPQTLVLAERNHMRGAYGLANAPS